MRFWLQSFVLLSLASGLLACGDDSNTNGPGGSGDCTCSVTIGSDTQDMVCGESSCLGPLDNDRWVTCTESGPHIKELERDSETRVWVGEGLTTDNRGIYVPVARERAQQLRDMLLASATGLRRTSV